MPTEIALSDGTKFRIHHDVGEALKLIGDPKRPTWLYINEGDDMPERHFNTAHVAYVIEVDEYDGTPMIAVIG